MHISTMLVFWFLVRNSVVLAVYLLFLVSASLPYMSIGARVVVAVTFQQVDDTPDTKTSTQSDNESLKNGNCLFKKCHK